MDGWIQIGTKLDSSTVDKEIELLEDKLSGLVEEFEILERSKPFEGKERELLKLTQEINRTTKRIQTLNKSTDELSKKRLSSLEKSISNLGNKTSQVISSTVRWAVAIFGIRSAYGMVSGAASTLAQYNDQIASDLEYIKFALASALQPVVEYMIQLVYKLLTYVNYLAKAWFGIDLFANASADAMNRTASSAEKVKKSLAGFDEMNVLNENGTTGAMGASVPSIDLSDTNLGDFEIPEWLIWIKDNAGELIPMLTGIAAGVVAIYSGAKLLTSLKIALVVGSITNAVQELLDYAEDPSWGNMNSSITGIGLAIGSVGVAFSSAGLIIGGAIAVIVGSIAYMANEIRFWFDYASVWISTNLDTMEEDFGFFATDIGLFGQGVFEFISGILASISLLVKGVVDSIGAFINGDWQVGLYNIGVGVVNFTYGILNSIIAILNTVIRRINKFTSNINKAFDTNIGKIGEIDKLKYEATMDAREYVPVEMATGGIINMPGRGVPLGGAIGGEVSKEGVIPLTDSQAMEELGATIGRYITINATITNNMNGRVISRELKKINSNSDFATNS